MASKIINMRIGLEGSEDIRKQLEELAAAGEQAFEQIGKAADEVKLEKLGEEGGTAAEGIAKAGEASQKTGTELDKVKVSADKASESMSKLSMETVKTGTEIAKNVFEITKTGVEIAQLVRTHESWIASLIRVAANVSTTVRTVSLLTPVLGTTAVVLGTVAAAAAAAAIALKAAGEAAAALAGPYEKLNHELQMLAQNSGQSFDSLQRGEALFTQIGIKAEEFRGVVGKVAEQLSKLDVSAELQKSADSIVEANKKVLEAEKAVIQQRLEGRKVFLVGEDASLTDYIGDVQRLKQLQAELNSETDKARELEDALLNARQKAAEAAANSLSKVLEQVKAIEAGQKGITFDSLVTAETKAKAFAISLKQAADAGQNAGQVLLQFIAAADRLTAIQIGKGFGITEEQVDRIQRLGGHLNSVDEIWKRIQSAGVLIPPESAEAFEKMRTEIQAAEQAWARLEQAWSSSVFASVGATVTSILSSIQTSFVNLAALALESMNSVASKVVEGWKIIGTQVLEGWKIIIKGIFSAASSLGGSVWDAFAASATSAFQTVIGWVDRLIGKLRAAASWLASVFGGAYAGGPGGAAAAPGHARGGPIGGRGSGTSDSNLAWVSRGEHIMPARAVRQPGVLAFLEALRRSGGNLSRVLDGMGRFATGGLVTLPAFAAGGGVGSMSHVTIAFPGMPSIGGLRAPGDVVDQLQRAAAMAQVRSGGRKPSRYS